MSGENRGDRRLTRHGGCCAKSHLWRGHMPIDQAQLTKVQVWMRTKFPLGLACPACHQKNWDVVEIVSAPTWAPNSIGLGGPTVPMVQMGCTNCGNVMFFAVAPMGLFPQQPPPTP